MSSGRGRVVFEEREEGLREWGFVPALFNVLDPLQQPAVVDGEQVHAVVRRGAMLKRRQEIVQELVGRTALPGRRAVKVHPHHQAVVQPALHDSFRGRLVTEVQPSGKVLKQRGLAVSRVPAQDDEVRAPLSDGAIQHTFEIGFNVGAGGEIGVEAACLRIPPP